MTTPTSILPLELQLIASIRWFIRLRWVPVFSIIPLTLAVTRFTNLDLPVFDLALLNIFILCYNVAFTIYDRTKIQGREKALSRKTHRRFAMIQIFLDWISLTALVHFTGGLLSPLAYLYAFHLVIASIFLNRWQVALQAMIALVLISLMALGEAKEILPHYNLLPSYGAMLIRNPQYMLLRFGTIAILLLGMTFLVGEISKRLRSMEKRRRDLQLRLQETLATIQEAERRQVVYRRTLTHELRAPISSTQSLLRVVLTGISGAIDADAKTILRKAESRLDILLDLIGDLLVLEKKDGSELQSGPVSLPALLKEVVQHLYPDMEEKNLNLNVQLTKSEAILNANSDSLERAFRNVLENAIKYSKAKGDLLLASRVANGCFEVQVVDTGIGIPEDEKIRLFQQFFRATNARKMTVRGTGLGLTIAKQILDQYKGEITVDSQENKGTQVTLRIPLPSLSKNI